MGLWIGLALAMGSSAWCGSWKEIWGSEAGHVPARFPIRAYSEFLPSPKGGAKAYEWRLDSPSTIERSTEIRRYYRADRPSQFQVSAFDEIRSIGPGLTHLTKDWLRSLKAKGPIAAVFSVALTRTQDDKGMTPWTVLGGAEGDPEEEFWRGLMDHQSFPQWLCGFLAKVKISQGPCLGTIDLERLGLRVLAQSELAPTSARRLSPRKGETFRILFTFAPESAWRPEWRAGFQSGRLTVIPHPSTLLPWRSALASRLARTNPDGLQIPLAEIFSNSVNVPGLRVPKVGLLPVEDADRLGLRKPGRFSRLATWDSDEQTQKPLSLFRLIFDSSPEVTELYGKPLARNSQIWGTSGRYEGQWVLDGPQSDKVSIQQARSKMIGAGPSARFAYRESFPPLDINGYSARWRRPVAAWYNPSGDSLDAELTSPGRVVLTKSGRRVELRVAFDDRWGIASEMAALVDVGPDVEPETTALNVQKLLEFSELTAGRLPPETASVLVTPLESPESFDFARWRRQLAVRSPRVAAVLETRLDDKSQVRIPNEKTLSRTLGEAFEISYWNKIVALTEGLYRDKNNVDCTAPALNDRCRRNHLPVISDEYFTPYYRSLGLEAKYHAFHWITDFDWEMGFDPARRWWGGLALNLPTRRLADIARDGHKNVVVVIPGQNHEEAVILADHYDTAYMDDVFREKGLRHASKGADDNHSGTATLMEAARVLKGMNLKRDVWLVHLTGEEFPADCLGARALTESLVTGTPVIAGKKNPKIVGLYVLDMIGHSTDRDHDPKAPSVFQIATGRGARAARLGQLAHEVTTLWNASVPAWNKKFKRSQTWERIVLPQSGKPEDIPNPRTAVFPTFRGEIRPGWHFKSALYNTDGIVFSDAGIPAVLLMENYDIGRSGYHDTHDTLENLDLDYAAGMARIAIESVAQAAME